MSNARPKPMSFFMLAFLAMLMMGVGESVIPTPSSAQPEGPVAFLAAVQGQVEIQRGDKVIEGTFGGALHSGDILKTGPGSRASFIYESGGGQIMELGPGSSIRIGASPDAGPVIAQIPEAHAEKLDQFVRDASGEAGLSALPNMRASGDGDEPEPLRPRNSKIAPESVTFTWKPVEDVLEYRILLSGEGVQAGSHSTTETEWAPETGFQPGSKWAWQVEAMTVDGSVTSREVSFEVATREQWEDLAAVQEQMNPLLESEDATSVDTGLFLLGTYCRSAGFFTRAITHFEDLVGRHPDRKELHLQLGALYMAIGRNDKAIEQRQMAEGE